MATTDDPLLPNRARLAVVQHQLQRAGANSSELPQIKAPASAATSAHEVASNRFETLRVLSRSGGACAAVSIASRLAVTALHCVRSLCESMHRSDASLPIDCGIEYENPDGFNGLTRVVAESENDLLALLELERPQSKYGALCCDDPRAEDRVYTVSHPAGVNWLMSYGRLTREPIPLEWVEGQATRVLVAEIPTKPGSSGGGLFDFEDRVVGIQIARWSPWTRDSSKAAFIQANRIFNFAGNYCIKRGSSACKGLRCVSRSLDVWRFN